MTASLPDRGLAWTLVAAVIAIVAGLAAHPSNALSGDEPHYLVIAHSIAFDGDVDVRNNYRDATLIASGLPDRHAMERGAALYPIHDVGLPLLLAPVVRVAYPLSERLPETSILGLRMMPHHYFKVFMCLSMAVISALLARQVLLVLRDLGAPPARAWWWALLFAATPPALSLSYLCFTETLTALLMLVVFRRLRLRPVESAAAAMVIGLAAGALLLIHIRNIGLVAGLVWLLVPLLRDRALGGGRLAAFIVGLAIAIGVRTAVTFAMWGEYVTTPYATFGRPFPFVDELNEVFVRASGLAFDRASGLMAYAPIYVLTLAGLIVLRQDRARLARDVVVIVVCAMLPILLPRTNPHGWRGGFSPATRFLLPIAPLLWIGVYYAAVRASTPGRWIVAGLVAIQIGMNAILWQRPKRSWPHDENEYYFPDSLPLPAWTDSAPMIWFVLLGIVVLLGSLWYVRAAIASIPSPATAPAPAPSAPA